MESESGRHPRVPRDKNNILSEMTALTTAAEFCRELDRLHVRYELQIVRAEALMMSIAVPGERWKSNSSMMDR